MHSDEKGRKNEIISFFSFSVPFYHYESSVIVIISKKMKEMMKSYFRKIVQIELQIQNFRR
jgi:hypothetical protein